MSMENSVPATQGDDFTRAIFAPIQAGLSNPIIVGGYLGALTILAGLGYGQGYWHVFGIDTATFDSSATVSIDYLSFGLWSFYDYWRWIAFLTIALMLILFSRYLLKENVSKYVDIFLSLLFILFVLFGFFLAFNGGINAGDARARSEVAETAYRDFESISITLKKTNSGENNQVTNALEMLEKSNCLRKIMIDKKNIYLFRAIRSVSIAGKIPNVYIIPISELSSIRIIQDEYQFCDT